MPIDPKYIDQIANGLTDDPDIFKESFGAVAKAGVDAAKKCASSPKCRDTAMAAGKWAVDKGKKMLNKRKAPEEEEAVAESYTNCCRNKVYRRGVTMNCSRACNSMYCESCTTALEESRIRVLGISENKKEPSNKPDDLEVEDSFEVHDDYDEDKKEPGKPGKQKRKSSLQDGPDGEKGSKRSPYLKEGQTSGGQYGRFSGLDDLSGGAQPAPAAAPRGKTPGSASPLGKVSIGPRKIQAAQQALNQVRIAMSPYDTDPVVKGALSQLVQAMNKVGYTINYPSNKIRRP